MGCKSFRTVVGGFVCLFLTACTTTNVPPKEPIDQTEYKALEAQKALVFELLDKGQARKALVELGPLVKKFPKDATIINLMGLTQLALQNYERAIKDFEKAYLLAPEKSYALNLSSAHIQQGHFQKARQILLGLLKGKDPADIDYEYPERILHNLALTYDLSRQPQKAEKYYKQALELNPTFYNSQIRLAQIYQQSGRPKLARKIYLAAMNNCTPCIEPIKALVESYTASNQKQMGAKIVQTYLTQKDLDPESAAEAKKMLKDLGKLD